MLRAKISGNVLLHPCGAPCGRAYSGHGHPAAFQKVLGPILGQESAEPSTKLDAQVTFDADEPLGEMSTLTELDSVGSIPRPNLARRFYEAFRGYSKVQKEELSDQKALDELNLGRKVC